MKILQNIKKWAMVAALVFAGAGNMFFVGNDIFANDPVTDSSAVPCLSNDCSEHGNLSKKSVDSVLKNIVNTLIGVIGFLAVLVVIYGGFLYTTSAGDANKVTKAKNAIMYGIIGIVVALMAYAIVNFVLQNVIK